MKKAGHFQVPLNKTQAVVYQVQEVSLQNRLLGEFRAAKGLKARVTVATELHKNAHDLADKQAAANEVIAALNAEIATYQRTQTSVALEAVFIRDELRELAGLPRAEAETTAAQVWSQDAKFAALMEALPAVKHHRALESFKAAYPER